MVLTVQVTSWRCIVEMLSSLTRPCVPLVYVQLMSSLRDNSPHQRILLLILVLILVIVLLLQLECAVYTAVLTSPSATRRPLKERPRPVMICCVFDALRPVSHTSLVQSASTMPHSTTTATRSVLSGLHGHCVSLPYSLQFIDTLHRSNFSVFFVNTILFSSLPSP